MVRVPTPEEEDAKRTHREREKLVQEAAHRKPY
jgi:transposase